MIDDAFAVEPASWSADAPELRALREQVFIIEQSIPREDEWDAFDATSRHAIARDLDHRPIGCGRLTRERKIGRMAVIAEWRGQGVGAALMRVLLEEARALRYTMVELHAQSQAVAFYEKYGFTTIGDEFLECDIPHRQMRLALPPPSERLSRELDATPIAQPLIAHDGEQALAAIGALLSAARCEIAISTRDLDPGLLDAPAILHAIKRIALSGRQARIRVIVREPRQAIADGHRLIGLAQRLPSTIALRTPVDESDLGDASAFVLNDRHGYFLRALAVRAEGDGSTFAPGRHARLLAGFDKVWERSTPSVELRALGI